MEGKPITLDYNFRVAERSISLKLKQIPIWHARPAGSTLAAFALVRHLLYNKVPFESGARGRTQNDSKTQVWRVSLVFAQGEPKYR
jgi:hypothetical protein